MARRCYPQINLPAALKWHLKAPSVCSTYLTANPRRPWRPSHAATNYSSVFTALNAVLIARGASGRSRHRRLLTARRAATALNQPLLVLPLGFSVLERDFRCTGCSFVVCGVVREAVAVPVLRAFERSRSGLCLR